MQQHLVQDAAEHIAVTGRARRHLDRLADRAAEGAGRAGKLLEDPAAHRRGIARRRRDGRAIGAHDLSAERLLLVGALDHKHFQVESQIRARHAQRRAPLSRAGLGCDAGEPLLLGVIRLRDGGVQLMRTGGVVALKLIIDLRGRLELFLQTVGAHQRRGAVHLVEIADVLRDLKEGGIVVQLLPHQLVAENRRQILKAHRLSGAGIQQRSRLHLHVRADIIPCSRHLIFGQIDFVGDLFG